MCIRDRCLRAIILSQSHSWMLLLLLFDVLPYYFYSDLNRVDRSKTIAAMAKVIPKMAYVYDLDDLDSKAK